MLDTELANSTLRMASRLTERSQTTIPAAIRDALGLKPGEFIEYALLPGGKAIMSRQQREPQDDPVVSQFLAFLENDMKKNPHHIQPATEGVWAGIEALTAGAEVDLDAPLTDD